VLTPEEMSFTFDIDPAVKKNMLSGLDDIGLTLEHESTISTFEADHDAQVTWA
jgi:3-isopropylmalate/(R)-2-methylmalate dehydratase small subunit